MSDRELKDIKLSDGRVAKIVTFFTRGEINEISRISWGEAVAENTEDAKITIVNIPVNQGQLDQDATVLQGTKFIDDLPTSKEMIDNLKIEDFKLILTELAKLRTEKKSKE